jgi:CelD/BcsL family acetyltransferase involved in cellulose biosynthesis
MTHAAAPTSPGRAPVVLRRLALGAVTDGDRARWTALADRAVQPTPFFRPEYVEAAARHLPGGARVELLVVEAGEGWLGVVPVRSRPKWSDLLLPCVRTWTHPYCFGWTPLVDRDAVDVTAQALRGAARAWPGRTFLALENATAGPLTAALLGEASSAVAPSGAFVHSGYARAVVRRRPEDTYLADHVKGKQRREMRRTRRILETTLGGPVALVDATEDPAAVDRFLALESGGWKGQAGSALSSDPEHEAFFREVHAAFGRHGRAHLLELRGGGRTAASVFCLRDGAEISALKIGYDEELGRGAPGIHLMGDLATWFHAETDAELLDSCAIPDHPMINGLWPDRRAHLTPILPAGGLAGRAVRALDARVRPRREQPQPA